jgi:hypothetical protein
MRHDGFSTRLTSDWHLSELGFKPLIKEAQLFRERFLLLATFRGARLIYPTTAPRSSSKRIAGGAVPL